MCGYEQLGCPAPAHVHEICMHKITSYVCKMSSQEPSVLLPPMPIQSSVDDQDPNDFARSKITGLRQYLEENDDDDDPDSDWDD